MIFLIKKLLYRVLSQRAYLRIMHRGFYLLYNLNLLKNKQSFKYHYAIKHLIKPEFTVVDIGANLGYFTKNFSKLAYRGKVVAIEPVPPFYATLKFFLGKKKNVTMYNCALGTENGKITMVLPETNGMLRTGLPHIPDVTEDTTQQKTTDVEIRKGSELLESLDRIDYIKCDIEGYEWTVFSEIKPIIEKQRPIVQLEIDPRNVDEMLQLFKELDYLQYGIKDFKFVLDQGSQAEQGDYLFVPQEKQQLIPSTEV